MNTILTMPKLAERENQVQGAVRMNEENDTTKTDREEKREVLVRFTPSELDSMKADTGAEAAATAGAAFVRKNLCKRA